MAQRSAVGVVGRLFALHAARDLDGVAALLHDDVVVTTVADGTTYVGKDEVCAYLWGDDPDGARTEVEAQRLTADGDTVLVQGRIRVHDGAGFADSPARWRVELAGGLVRRIDPARSGALLPSSS